MINIRRDGNGQLYVNWQQGTGSQAYKRAWVQHREGDKDWAGTRRYLNVVRAEGLDSGPGGNATDFPVFSNMSDEQVLRAFVYAVCGITGCPLP